MKHLQSLPWLIFHPGAWRQYLKTKKKLYGDLTEAIRLETEELEKDRFSLTMGPLAAACKPDASTEKKIRFKGKAYVLVGNMKFGGAIATKKQYEAGECPYAHLCPDGFIRRFNEIIGTRDEITIKENR